MSPTLAQRAAELLAKWKAIYGASPMGPGSLRDRFHDRWLRIHSLPESKRYSETPEEAREILRRQNCVLTELLGEGAPCAFFFSTFSDRLPDELVNSLQALAPIPLATISAEESPLETEFLVEIAFFDWRSGLVDPILTAVADDVLASPSFVTLDCQRVIAPYDGGMDIFVERTQLRDELRVRYRDWLSRHPKGL